jgi:ABC-type lipoprotein release transport system permease subunit
MSGPNLTSMAWRNLWRHRRRTLLTLSSIAFGTMLAWLFTGLGDANWRKMIDLAARLGGGHVTLQQEAEDTSTLSLLDAVAEGELFGSNGRGGIVLGAKLAENLRVRVGHKVVYTLTDKGGEIVQEAVRVTGILRTGAPTVDGALVLLPIDYVRGSLGYGADEAGQVAVFLDDQRAADQVAARLSRQVAGGDERVVALPWHVLQPELAGFIAMKVGGAWIMEAIIMLLVAAGIFNTIFVGVMERMREFGILRALGWTPGQLSRLVLTESALLAAAGIALGVLVTAGPYVYLNRVGVDVMAAMAEGQVAEIAGIAVSTRMFVDIYPENALMIGAAALGATLLSGVYPAWRAGRVDPAETIRLV